MSHSDVLVIGAGPAGLTAAYLLTKQGVPTTVIEADPTYVGGISRTASYKGFLFDIGGHRFFSKSKEVVDLWNEILPDDFIERPRLSRIYYNGKFFSYPLKAFEALNNLGYVESALCVLSYLREQAFPTANPRELPRLGRQSVRRAPVLDLLQDLHGEGVGHELRRDLGRLGRAAHQGPRPVERHVERAAQSLPRAAMPKKGGQLIKTLIETFQYPRKGPGMMWEAAAQQGDGPRRPHPHGHPAREPALESQRQALDHRRDHGRRGMEGVLGGARHLVGADPRAGGEHPAASRPARPRPRSCAIAIS